MSVKQVTILGDSVLKGIQIDLRSQRYRTQNQIDIPALESEFGLCVRNDSHFGATVRKGEQLLARMIERGVACDILVMDFGGNDCDHRWREIAENPTGEHLPNVPLAEFVERYRGMLRLARRHGMEPVVTTLPPIHAERFFRWWCGDLDQDAVLDWLGDRQNIYSWQERYSRAVEELAREEGVHLVDVRGAFLRRGHIERLLCADGTHPNSEGQQVITQAFRDFGRAWREERQAV